MQFLSIEDIHNFCEKYINWIIPVIVNFLFKSKIAKILSLIFLFMFMFLYSKIFSVNAKNKQFFKDFYSYVEDGGILQQVINHKRYNFQNDDIQASLFFEQIISACIDITKQYGKENVKIYQYVINEKPSNPYQLNGDIDNDKIIFNNISSKDKKQKQLREESMVRRKKLLDADLDLTAISIYARNGVMQQTFEDNIKKYKNKLFGKKIRLEQISGINAPRRGQIFIVKFKKTGHFMIFREIGGAQAHDVAQINHLKTLDFYDMKKLKSQNDIKKIDYSLYSLMQDFELDI